MLSPRKIHFVALVASPDHVDFVHRFGNKVSWSLRLPFSEAHRTMEIFRDHDAKLLAQSSLLHGDQASLQKKATPRAKNSSGFEADPGCLIG